MLADSDAHSTIDYPVCFGPSLRLNILVWCYDGQNSAVLSIGFSAARQDVAYRITIVAAFERLMTYICQCCSTFKDEHIRLALTTTRSFIKDSGSNVQRQATGQVDMTILAEYEHGVSFCSGCMFSSLLLSPWFTARIPAVGPLSVHVGRD